MRTRLQEWNATGIRHTGLSAVRLVPNAKKSKLWRGNRTNIYIYIFICIYVHVGPVRKQVWCWGRYWLLIYLYWELQVCLAVLAWSRRIEPLLLARANKDMYTNNIFHIYLYLPTSIYIYIYLHVYCIVYFHLFPLSERLQELSRAKEHGQLKEIKQNKSLEHMLPSK